MRSSPRRSARRLPPYRPTALLPLLAWCGAAALLAACGETITVGSKNFTESVILGELVAQRLEAEGYGVRRRFFLGGTFVCHEALTAGDLDVYVEYTGTAHSAILELSPANDRELVYRQVDSLYRERWNVEWTEPLGFNNTFAMLVRGEDARRLGLSTLSGAVPHAPGWRPGFGYEFMERADGYAGLVATYGLTFGRQPAVMDLGLTYRALADGQVDIIAGNSTDGQIEALDLVHLADDRGYFPPYDAVPVVRREVLQRHPAIRDVLRALGGVIDEAAMRRLNYLVDVEQRDAGDVVAEFLAQVGAGPSSFLLLTGTRSDPRSSPRW